MIDVDVELLYQQISPPMISWARNQLRGGNSAEDVVHDTFLILLDVLERDKISEPEKIISYCWCILRRNIIKRIYSKHYSAALIPTIPPETPEEIYGYAQKMKRVAELIGELNPLDQEILTRFYINEQSPTEICEAMGITQTVFRVRKSRAKAALTN